ITANRVVRYLGSSVASSFIASVATAPYAVYHFNYFSAVGMLANVIAVPLTTLIVIPLGIVYLMTRATLIEPQIGWLLEVAVEAVLKTAIHMSKVEWLIPRLRSIPAAAVTTMTLGMLIYSIWRGRGRVYLGLSLIGVGTIMATRHQTPDIILNASGLAAKESDGKLYYAMRKGNPREYACSSWARENGQPHIVQQNEYEGQDRRLKCTYHGCQYDDKVLISEESSFVTQKCKEVELVIYMGDEDYPAACGSVPHLTKKKAAEEGTYYVTTGSEAVRVRSTRTKRPWHINASGHEKRLPKKKKTTIQY
ncbi:MAG: ComEC/Rec2 family competence protein, partial [Anaplasma sp.]